MRIIINLVSVQALKHQRGENRFLCLPFELYQRPDVWHQRWGNIDDSDGGNDGDDDSYSVNNGDDNDDDSYGGNDGDDNDDEDDGVRDIGVEGF